MDISGEASFPLLPSPSAATFHPGTIPARSTDVHSSWLQRQALRAAARQERRIRAHRALRARISKLLHPPVTQPPPRKRVWYLLPPHQISDSRVILPFYFAGTTLKDVEETFRKHVTGEITTPIPAASFLAAFKAAMELNQRVRARMTALALRWLRARKVVPGNTEDLVTLEPPQHPVRFMDWPARRLYTFEAATLYRDMLERLLLHDQVFPTTAAPRNPYTNLPLTIGQLHTAFGQLQAAGKSHWALDAFARCGYALPTFKRNYAEPLKHSALKRLFQVTNHPDYIDLLYEFIQDEHEQHEQHFNSGIYLWALQNDATCTRMIKWRQLCYRYHEMNILIKDHADLGAAQDREIGPATEALCSPPMELLAARNLWHKQLLTKKE